MPGLTVHFEVLNQLNSPALYADTLANRPAAQLVGRIFFRTDSPFGIYRDTGSAWDLIASPDTTGISGSGLAGQVPYFTGASTIGGTNNLFWDSTNNRLGIGTATPGVSLDIHGAGSIVQINGTGTSNAFEAFQNAGTTKWRVGNNYSAATNYFSIYDFANSVESFKLESGATNILTINASTTNQGNIKIQKAGANPRLEIQQDTPSATNKSEVVFLAPVGFGAISKYTSSTTALKIIAAEDFGIYNYASSGDIAVLNDFATGKIKFAAGGSSTAQATLTAAGRLLIGTTTEGTEILKVNGTSILNGFATISGSTTAASAIARGALISSTLVASANSDVLVGLDISPTFTNGAFTGVTNLAARFNGNIESSNFKATFDIIKVGISAVAPSLTGGSIVIGGYWGGGNRYTAQSMTTGTTNIIIGKGNASYITTGSDNIALGQNSLNGNSTTQQKNIAIGTNSLGLNTGDSNVAIGYRAAQNITSGGSNIILGIDAATSQADGTTNLALTGSNNIYIGQQVRGFNNTDTNAIVIGSVGIGLGSNTTVIGNSSTTLTALRGSTIINATSINASAVLQADSTASGFLPPRMTTTQKNAIGTPAAGLIVFDTTLAKLCVYSGSAWQTITSV